MDKRQYYSLKGIVENYEAKRFGGRSGSFVNFKELSIVEELFSGISGKILDLPCGTGRALERLSGMGLTVVGADYSLNMLNLSKSRLSSMLTGADILALPFRQGSFDGALSLRFLFHYKDVDIFFKNLSYVVRNQGVVVFDICQWSPRVIFGLFDRNHVGRIYIHNIRKLKELLKKYNFEIVQKRSCFLLPAFFYRFLPFFVITFLEKIEKVVPERFLTRIFLKVKRIEKSNKGCKV